MHCSNDDSNPTAPTCSAHVHSVAPEGAYMHVETVHCIGAGDAQPTSHLTPLSEGSDESPDPPGGIWKVAEAYPASTGHPYAWLYHPRSRCPTTQSAQHSYPHRTATRTAQKRPCSMLERSLPSSLSAWEAPGHSASGPYAYARPPLKSAPGDDPDFDFNAYAMHEHHALQTSDEVQDSQLSAASSFGYGEFPTALYACDASGDCHISEVSNKRMRTMHVAPSALSPSQTPAMHVDHACDVQLSDCVPRRSSQAWALDFCLRGGLQVGNGTLMCESRAVLEHSFPRQTYSPLQRPRASACCCYPFPPTPAWHAVFATCINSHEEWEFPTPPQPRSSNDPSTCMLSMHDGSAATAADCDKRCRHQALSCMCVLFSCMCATYAC